MTEPAHITLLSPIVIKLLSAMITALLLICTRLPIYIRDRASREGANKR